MCSVCHNGSVTEGKLSVTVTGAGRGRQPMARMTDEQREQRALLRARRAAEAEEEDRRTEERRQQRQREGTYMSCDEIEAVSRAEGAASPCWTAWATGLRCSSSPRNSGLSTTGWPLHSANGTSAAGQSLGACAEAACL